MSEPANAESRFWPAFRVCSGNFLEMYDFMVFGYFADHIGRTFFPTGSPFASLMLALMTFGAGFLMRPLGAVVLGAYTDRHGRRAGMLLTLGLMAAGTMTLALTPGYHAVGLLAPVLVVAGRLVQGFSAGAELGGVSVYLAEVATPGRKGFFVSWQSASQQVAVVLAAALGVALGSSLSADAMAAWGWRVPLLVGCLIVPLLFVLRRSLEETGEFLARRHRPGTREILRSLAANWPVVLVGVMLVTMTTASFYLLTIYAPTYGREELGLGATDALTVTLCVGASNFFWLPVMGALSDRLGRPRLLLASAALTLVTAYPALHWLAAEPSFTRLLVVELWLSLLYAAYNGAMVVYLTEIMPPEVRTAGFSLAYSLATALFGGFTPAVCTGLVSMTGDRAIPGAWLGLAALLGLVATAVALRRGGTPRADPAVAGR